MALVVIQYKQDPLMELIWKWKLLVLCKHSRVPGTPRMPSISRAIYLLFSLLMWTGPGDPLGGEEEGLSDWDSRTRHWWFQF